LALVLFALSVCICAAKFPGTKNHPIAQLAEYRRAANEAFANGTPVVSTDLKMAVMTYLSVIWEGPLPRIQTEELGTGKSLWFAFREEPGDEQRNVIERLEESRQTGSILRTRAIGIPGTDAYTFKLDWVPWELLQVE
jgi:hypothetical protein